MAVIGYARVSTSEQNLNLQLDALMQAGCDKIYHDQGISAVAVHRPSFEQAMNKLKSGDTFIVWKLDRAFRSLKNALAVLETFEQQNIEFRCLTEPIDTTTPMGKCMYQIRSAFAELERNFIRERTIAGMNAAKKRGVKVGRPKKLTQGQIDEIKQVFAVNPTITQAQYAVQLGVSLRTLTRALNGK